MKLWFRASNLTSVAYQAFCIVVNDHMTYISSEKTNENFYTLTMGYGKRGNFLSSHPIFHDAGKHDKTRTSLIN